MDLIILASGRSSRLYPLTSDTPKCLLPIGSETLIGRLSNQLLPLSERAIITTGHCKEGIETCEDLRQFKKIFFPNYYKYNNLHTLLYIIDELTEDCLISFADIFLSDEILDKVKAGIELGKSFMLVDTAEIREGTMAVELNGGNVSRICPPNDREKADANFIGIAYYDKDTVTKIKSELLSCQRSGDQNYYTFAVNRLIESGCTTLDAVDVNGGYWMEVDTYVDLVALRNKYGY